MEMTFNVHYNAIGIPDNMVDVYGRLLMRAHNVMANLTNDYYETWNKEFEEIHPGFNGDDPIYMDYISRKMYERCGKKLDKMFGKVMTFTIGDECQLVGHPTAFPGSTIDFDMVPVN